MRAIMLLAVLATAACWHEQRDVRDARDVAFKNEDETTETESVTETVTERSYVKGALQGLGLGVLIGAGVGAAAGYVPHVTNHAGRPAGLYRWPHHQVLMRA